MAGIHGKNGSVHVVGASTTKLANTNNWTLNELQETAEDRVHEQDWVGRVAGMRDWNVSIEGQVALGTATRLFGRIATGTAVAMATVFLQLRHSDSTVLAFAGLGIITDISTSAPVGDIQTFSATVAGAGALKYAAL